MTGRDDLLPGLDELGDELGRAARRRSTRRSPLRLGRGVAVAGATLLIAAGAATAARLIAVGEPVLDERDLPEGLRPEDGERRIVVRAADPSGGLVWGASVYRSADGRACILAGVQRGASLGVVDDGRFRPYSQQTRGSCGDLRRTDVFFTTQTVRQPSRTLVFGRTDARARVIRIRSGAESRTVGVTDGGAFLVVFDDDLDSSTLRVDPGR